MDLESKKEYLKKYKVLTAKINRLRWLLSENPEQKEKYTEKINSATALRDKIEQEIDSVDGGLLSEILAEKFICGKSLEEISLIIGYCKRHIERLYLKALEEICICF